MRAAGRVFSLENILPWLVLGILLAYTYALFFERPYAGFSWDAGGRVVRIYAAGNEKDQILQGDRLIRVGPVSWEQFQANLRLQLFRDVRDGESIPIVIERGGRQLELNWTYPGKSPPEFFDQVISVVWYGLFFWVVGTDCLVNVRPRGQARGLAVACNYLTATWIIMLANLAAYHIWYSPYVLRCAAWLSAPSYLLFHWVWPRPLGRLPGWVIGLAYIGAAVVAAADCLRWLPEVAHLWGLGLAFGGMLVLLAAHAIRTPADRPALRRLLGIVVLGALPLLTVPLLRTVLEPNQSIFVGLVGLPLVATGYFAAIFRNELGSLEWRAQRVVSVYAFMTVMSFIMLPVLVLAGIRNTNPGITLVMAGLAGLAAGLVSIFVYPPFQSFYERHLLGVPHSSSDLMAAYARRITASTSELALTTLLQHEILPSLLVRRFAFVQVENGETRTLLAHGILDEEIPSGSELRDLIQQGRDWRGVHAKPGSSPYSWIGLAAPLRIEGTLIGVWLLGRGHPDGAFSRSETALIESLAAQTAIALSNMRQAERLRVLYQADVTRHEEERLQLARELHDHVLSQMAVLVMKLDAPVDRAELLAAYESLIDRLRDIVGGLRPTMLSMGLKAAIQDLADRSTKRALPGAQVQLELPPENVRLPPEIELHLFRILEESVANALQHAHAATVRISVQMDPQHAELVVQDDGMGFDMPEGAALENLVAEKHFGLAGLQERANLIGGAVKIESKPGLGTRIHVSWPARSD